MIIGIEFWLHAHAETGKPILWDLLAITGDRIPMHLIDDLKDDTVNAMQIFSTFEPENAYSVVLDVKCNNEEWYINSLEGKLKLPNPYDNVDGDTIPPGPSVNRNGYIAYDDDKE